jgi:hypothetical protein
LSFDRAVVGEAMMASWFGANAMIFGICLARHEQNIED